MICEAQISTALATATEQYKSLSLDNHKSLMSQIFSYSADQQSSLIGSDGLAGLNRGGLGAS